jgi:hypothetical protein
MARSTNSSNASVRGDIRQQLIRGQGKMTRDEGDLSIFEMRNYLKKYYENEKDNYHSENVVLTAKMFGTPEQLAQAKAIQTRHDVIGYLTPESQKERDALEKKLFVEVSRQQKKLGLI